MAETLNDTNDLAAWRRDYEDRLRADWGWLTVTGLHWLEDGAHTIGSSAEADIRLEPGLQGSTSFVPDLAAKIIREGHKVSLEILSEGAVLLEGRPAESHRLKFSGSQGQRFTVGHQSFLVVQRGDRVGVRTWNNDAEQRRTYTGSDWFEPDDGWIREAHFRPFAEPRIIEYLNVLGDQKSVLVSGEWVFELEGRELTLISLADEDQAPFFVFRDGTSGTETYGASRFLQAPAPQQGRTVLDFNRAYNPPCAFTPHATCPLPPRQNVLDVRITAGERLYEPA